MRTHLLLAVLLAGGPAARAADAPPDARETLEQVKESLEKGPPPEAGPSYRKAHEEALKSTKETLKALDGLDETMKKFVAGAATHKVFMVMEKREERGPVLLVHRLSEGFDPHSEVMLESDKDKAKVAGLLEALLGASGGEGPSLPPTVKIETLDERFARERPAQENPSPEVAKYDKEHKAKLKADMKGHFAVVYRYRKPEPPAEPAAAQAAPLPGVQSSAPHAPPPSTLPAEQKAKKN